MDLAQVLQGCFSADNTTRQQAEAALAEINKQPTSAVQWLRHLETSPSDAERQLAATQLRNRIKAAWRALSPGDQAGIKASLLVAVVREPVTSVINLEADVIAFIARTELPNDKWPELLPWLHACCTAADTKHQVIGMRVLKALLERTGTYLVPHIVALLTVCSTLMAGDDSELRQASIAALVALCPFIVDDANVAAFQRLVPRLLQLSQGMVAAQRSEDEASAAIHLFQELAECPSPLLGKSVSPLLNWSLQIAASQQLPLPLRREAVQVIETLACSKPKQFVRAVRPNIVVQTLCNMCMEPGILEADETDMPASRIGSQALDALSLSLPTKHILPESLACAHQAIHSPDSHVRHAACSIACVITEGCAETLKEDLQGILQIIGKGLQDTDAMVRGMAAYAMGQLAEHCSPEITKHAREALSLIFNVLQDSQADTQEQAFYAMVTFCDALGESLMQDLRCMANGKSSARAASYSHHVRSQTL